MCGIAGLQLRDPALHPQMGSLLSAMLCQIVDRGPDSAGLAVYGDPGLALPEGTSTSQPARRTRACLGDVAAGGTCCPARPSAGHRGRATPPW